MTTDLTWDAPDPGQWVWQGSHLPGVPTPIENSVDRPITSSCAPNRPILSLPPKCSTGASAAFSANFKGPPSSIQATIILRPSIPEPRFPGI